MAGKRPTVDFDAAWKERGLTQASEDERGDIRMFGAVFPRRASLPAAVTLWLGRLTSFEDIEQAQQGLSIEQIYELLKLIVGEKVVEQWLYDQKLGEDDLKRALLGLVALYNGVEPSGDGDGEGEGEAPKRGSSARSSKAGRSSKPTGSANTGET